MNELQELKINARFRDIIPPLNAEEYENLRESIKTEGCRDAIVVWQGVIVDGHNRYGICTEHNIPFRTFEKTFEDEDDAAIWIMKNQICRRNLPDVERGRLALKLKDCIVARARKNQGTRNDLLANLPKSEPINTRKELAKIAGIGERTIAKIEKVDSEAPAPIREAMGKEISIDKAARMNTVLKKTPEEEREAEARRLLAAELAEREERIYREEKIVKKVFNIVSAATMDYEYITDECVEIYLKKSPIPPWDVANSIDDEIEWLKKIKEMVLRLGKDMKGERWL